MMKRFLAMLLAAAIVLSFAPVMTLGVFAAEYDEPAAETVEVDRAEAESAAPSEMPEGTADGNGSTVTWDLTDGVLTISGTGAMENYSGFSATPWYSNRSTINEVVIANGVTTIGKYAFYGCSNLTSITIPESISSIGEYAFRGCSKLTSISIPKDITSIENSTFAYCSSLKTVSIPNGVTSIGDSAFSSCSSLETVSIPNGVKSIGTSAFSGCSSLKTISIPESVNIIRSTAFSSCSSLTGITVDEKNTVFSSDNNGILFDKNKTQIILVPSAGLSGDYVVPDTVTSIGDFSFSGCSKLTSISMPSSVTSINASAFWGCSGLTSINIPNTVTYIGMTAFSDCSKLTSINIPYGVKDLGFKMFNNCSSLKSITIPATVTRIGNSAFGNCTGLTEITIPDSVTSIDSNAFYGCSGLVCLKMSDSVTSIGSGAFMQCENLKVVFYSGTQAQHSEMTIRNSNDCLTDAAWHYEYEKATFAEQDCYYCAVCDNYFLLNGDYAKATIVFKNVDGNIIETQYVKYNDTVVPPAMPVKDHDQPLVYKYEVVWDKEIVPCNGNATYTATAEYKEVYIDYTVKFVDEDGDLISEKTYHYGDTVEIPENPTKAAGNTYAYVFDGWDTDVVSVCSGNATYTATYKEVYIDYTVKFVDDNGDVILEKTYHYGDAVEIPEDPEKAADNTYTYEFDGWDSEVSATCTGNVTYTATYKGTYIDYTVKFVDENGDLISEKTYHYGDAVEIPEDPEKEEDEDFTYEFAGWDPEVVETCQGNATYTAVYEATKKPIVNPFTDVKEKDWFYNPVLWAVDNGITSGVSATNFSPSGTCTRAQVVTFLWNQAGQPEPTSTDNPFTDVKSSAWYYKAVLWAVEEGITAGKTATTFAPNEICTRAQVVTFIWNAEGQPEPTSTDNPFTDVKSSAWYYKAVLWAVENGVTSGVAATKFGPNNTCTRAQVVTFLYNHAGKPEI